MKQQPVIQVTTAQTLTAALKKKVSSAIEKKFGATAVEFAVEPSLIGGVKLTVNSAEYDGSVRGKLAQLKQQLLASSQTA